MKIYLGFVILILATLAINTIAQKFLKPRWSFWLGSGIPALTMSIFLWNTSDPRAYDFFGDFSRAYYPAGRLILQNPSELYNDFAITGFVNIPILAFLFTPFTVFNESSSKILFGILSGLTVLVTFYLLISLTKVFGWRRIPLLWLFVLNGPLYYSLRYGNLTHFVLLLLLATFFCLQKRGNFCLGILLAIAALIKIPLFLLGIYFFVRGRWRVAVGFGVTIFVIVGASLLLFGLDLHIVWYHQCIQPFLGKPISAYNVQSVDAFLARLLLNTNDELRNWEPIEVAWQFRVIRYALLSLLIGTTTWICWRSKSPATWEVENLEFSIVLCLALVISPISWTHYYLFLLLPFALYFANQLAIPQGRIWSSLVIVSIFLTSLPVITAGPANPVLNFLYSKLLVSHYFLGGILFLGVLLAARWQSAKRSRLSQGVMEPGN